MFQVLVFVFCSMFYNRKIALKSYCGMQIALQMIKNDKTVVEDECIASLFRYLSRWCVKMPVTLTTSLVHGFLHTVLSTHFPVE